MRRPEEENLSLQHILDDISELIYIADVDNYDLLYVNSAGIEQFGLEEVKEGIKCYEAFQNRSTPCPFCTNKVLKMDADYIWSIKNDVTGRYYRLKDRLIPWKDHHARMEIAFDITEVSREREALQYAFDTEKMVLECVKIMTERKDIQDSMLTVLRMVGEYLSADRVYIFEIKNERLYNTYEWCSEGVLPEKENLQDLDLSIIQSWNVEFKKQRSVVIEDLSTVEDRELYDVLYPQGIKSLVMAPLESNGRLIGCFGVDNPPVEKIRNITSLLDTLRYFIMLTIQKSMDEALLEHLSLHDTLTGLYNRNKYMLDVSSFSKQQHPLGIFYLDVNGLKEINDQYGHACGDLILMKCTRKIKSVFGDANAYRTGGDEFIVIAELDNEDQIYALRDEIKKQFLEDPLCSVAIGCRWAEDPSCLERIIEEADNFMYEDKKRHYENSSAQPRKRYRLTDRKTAQKEVDFRKPPFLE